MSVEVLLRAKRAVFANRLRRRRPQIAKRREIYTRPHQPPLAPKRGHDRVWAADGAWGAPRPVARLNPAHAQEPQMRAEASRPVGFPPGRLNPQPNRRYDAKVSWKRTGLPPPGMTISSSRITTRPRMMVAMGQPVVSKPSNGVQPERVAIWS